MDQVGILVLPILPLPAEYTGVTGVLLKGLTKRFRRSYGEIPAVRCLESPRTSASAIPLSSMMELSQK